MKNLFALSALASFAVVAGLTSTSAYADNERTAEKNTRRADNQMYKADRAAMRGNEYRAEKHAENAAKDEYKVQKNENRAFRDAERSY